MAAAIPLGKILIEKDLEKERKRDAAQMSAVALGFFLDREGHKKFLRVATNQELEAENKRLEAENEALKKAMKDKTYESDYWFTEAKSYERSWELRSNDCQQYQRELVHFKKAAEEQFDKRCKAEEEKRALELRIQKAIRKALHPDMPDTEDEATSPETPSTPSERASIIEGDVLFGDYEGQFDGGNDGDRDPAEESSTEPDPIMD